MKLYSTSNKSLEVDLRTAVIKSLPADNGLYMPTQIPQMPGGWFEEIHQYGFTEIAYQVA